MNRYQEARNSAATPPSARPAAQPRPKRSSTIIATCPAPAAVIASATRIPVGALQHRAAQQIFSIASAVTLATLAGPNGVSHHRALLAQHHDHVLERQRLQRIGVQNMLGIVGGIAQPDAAIAAGGNGRAITLQRGDADTGKEAHGIAFVADDNDVGLAAGQPQRFGGHARHQRFFYFHRQRRTAHHAITVGDQRGRRRAACMGFQQRQRRGGGFKARHFAERLAAAAIDKARLDGGATAFQTRQHRQNAINILQRHGQVVSGFRQPRQRGAAFPVVRRQLGGQALRRGTVLQWRGEHRQLGALPRQYPRHPHQTVFVHRRKIEHPHRQVRRRARRMALIGVKQPVAQGRRQTKTVQRDQAHAQRQKQRGRQHDTDGPGPGHEAPKQREKPRLQHPIIVNGADANAGLPPPSARRGP
jgi:hypothetical protein